MKYEYPASVLISGGRETGGVSSFAQGLRAGFAELGFPSEVVPPSRIYRRLHELRDPRILKIVSTTAVFAAPLARRTICLAHGFPCVAYKGWPTTFALLASYRLATACRGTQLVAVSDYSALTLRVLFGLPVDAVIRNPVLPLFLQPAPDADARREAVTFVGRLHPSKNVARLLPAMRDVLDENPGLRAWIIGDGPLRADLELITAGDDRIEFLGALPSRQVRERLRRSRVFVSANPTEPFGIVYLEALSQGCQIVMPASGGGLEIAPELIGTSIQLFPASMERAEVASALRKALIAPQTTLDLTQYSASSVAKAYLAVDAAFRSMEAGI